MTKIVGKQVGPIGFGLMAGLCIPHVQYTGLTLDSKLSDDTCFAAMKAALDAGCNYWNSGEFYGTRERNLLTLLRKYFEKYAEDADKVVINIKGSLGDHYALSGSKEKVTESVENVLKILGPVKNIDQYELARKDIKCDYEKDTLGTIDGFVSAGKIGGIACSEINAATIRSAVKSFQITSVELELSLFHIAPLTNGTLEACGDLGIPVLASSPLDRGFLGGRLKSAADLEQDDFRRMMPRYQEENFGKTMQLVTRVEGLAKKKGCTTCQIAINWLLSLSKRPGMPTIIPIPGSSKPEWVRENATLVEMTAEDLAELDRILASFVPAGERYPAPLMKDVEL